MPAFAGMSGNVCASPATPVPAKAETQTSFTQAEESR